MLSEPLDLSKVNATELIDFLYAIFHRDFVASRTLLANKIYINPKSNQLDDEKERVFWHLTTKNDKQWQYDNNGHRTLVDCGRYPDFGRASKLEWVKQILENHDNAEIKLFYHKESTGEKDIRLYLWAYNYDFVVILQRLGKSQAYLVTSFYITHEGKRKDYEKRYQIYQAKTDSDLENCEWF